MAQRLDALDRTSANPDVDVDTGKAEKQVGSFATQMNRQLTQAIAALPDVELGADASEADRRIAAIRAELVGLASQRIGIDIDAGEAQRRVAALRAELAHLGARSSSVRVQADTAAASRALGEVNDAAIRLNGRVSAVDVLANVARALGALATVASALDAIDGRLIRPDITIDAGPALARLAAVGGGMAHFGATTGAASLRLAALATTMAAAVQTVGSLGSALAPAVGALALLPAAGVAGALAVGTVKVAFSGFGDAIGDDPKKAAEALAKMSPAAREAAMAVNGLKPAWQGLQLDVQQRMFAGLGTQITGLGQTYLPILRGAMAGLASDINGNVVAAFDVLRERGNITGISTGLGFIRQGLGAMSGALAPLTQAFTTLFIHGAPYVAQFGAWVESTARSFSLFIGVASRGGAITMWIDNAIAVLKQLGSIIGNVGSILFSFFSVAASSGQNFLTVLDRGTASMAAFLHTPAGAGLLVALFDGMSAAVAAAQPLLTALGQTLVGVILPAVASALPSLGAALGMLAPAMAPLGQIIAALLPVVAALAGVVAQVLSAALSALAPILVALAPLFVTLAQTLGAQLIGAITALTPFLVGLATFMGQHPGLIIGVVSVLSSLFGAWQLLSGAVAALLGPLTVIRIGMMLFGVSVSTLLGPLFAAAGTVGSFMSTLASGFTVMNLGGVLLRAIGVALTAVIRAVLGALGPIGMLILIFSYLFTSNEQFRTAIMGLLAVFGQLIGDIVGALMPAFTALTPVLDTAGSVFAGIAAGLATALVPVVEALAAALQWLSPIIAPLAAVFLGVRAAMLLWAAAQWLLNTAMAANPMGLLVLAIAALVGGLVYAWQNSETFRNIVIATWEAIKTAAVTVFTAVRDFIVAAWAAISGAFTASVGFLAGLWNGFWTGLQFYATLAWTLITAAVQLGWAMVSGAFSAAVGFLVGLWNGFWAGLSTAASFAWTLITTAVQFGWSLVTGAFNAAIGFLADLWTRFWTGLQVMASFAWNLITTAVQFGWSLISNAFNVAIGFLTDLWNRFWTGLQVMASVVWAAIQAVVSTAWAGVQAVFAGAVAVLSFLWNNFWNGLQFVASLVWAGIQAVVSGAWAAVQAIFNGAVAVLTFLWNGFWTGLQVVATTVWNAIAGFFSGAFAAFTDFFTDRWNNLRNNAINIWNAIADFFRSAFGAFQAFFAGVWNAVVDFFTERWNTLRNNGVNAWNALSAFFAGAFAAFTRFFGDTWNNIVATFDRVWSGIIAIAQRVWDAVRGAFVGGVNAIIDVINFFSGAINKVAGLLGFNINLGIPRLNAGGEIDAVRRSLGGTVEMKQVIRRADGGGVDAAGGGRLPGYSPGRDTLPALAGRRQPYLLGGGEYITQARATRAVGSRGMAAVNNAHRNPVDIVPRSYRQRALYSSGGPTALAAGGQVDGATTQRDEGAADRTSETGAPNPAWNPEALPGDFVRYEDGSTRGSLAGARGVGLWEQMWGIVQRGIPGARLTSSVRRGDPGYHGKGKAIDISGPRAMDTGAMGNINRWIAGRFPNSTQLIYTPGINLLGGRPHRYNSATQAGHYDHVHWAMENAAMLGGAAGPPGTGSGGGVFATIINFLRDQASSLLNPLRDRLIPIRDNAGEGFGKRMVAGTGLKIIDHMFAKAAEQDAATAAASAAAGGGGANMGPATSGQLAHAREIAAAAKERGIGRDGFIIALMTGLQESGIRILANRSDPASLGMPNEGVGADHDSTGIFQQRRAGWGTLAMRMNARASAGMFFNKLGRGPYGDFGAAAQRVQVSKFPGAYSKWRGKAEGIANAVGFDRGGLATGRGLLAKDIIRPERVLDPRTTVSFERLVGVLDSGRAQPVFDRLAAAQGVRGTGGYGRAGGASGGFPDEFRLSSDTALRIDGDGLLHIIDGHLVALADSFDNGRA